MNTFINMLNRIKNAQAVYAERVLVPFSNMNLRIAQLLNTQGYLASVERRTKKVGQSEHEYLDLELKYDEREGAISGVKVVSKPSRRMYVKTSELKPVRSGRGIAVLSTPKGILSSVQARKEKVGGELLFEIW